jgi:hypothetical protein
LVKKLAYLRKRGIIKEVAIMANSFANNTSAYLETIAINRYRQLMSCIPKQCRIFREVWGNSTIVCLDFVDCQEDLESTLQQSWLLLAGLQFLGLGSGIIFRIKQKMIKIINN